MPRRNWGGGIVAVSTLWLLAASPCRAEDAKPQIEVEVVSPGSSVAATRKKALADLPLDKVTADFRPRVDEIVKNVSLFRRMPTLKFVSEPEVYNFFLAHPDVAVSLWRVMDISTFEMWQTSPIRFEADSHDGSTVRSKSSTRPPNGRSSSAKARSKVRCCSDRSRRKPCCTCNRRFTKWKTARPP